MKKLISIFIAAVLVLFPAMPAFAHGGCHGYGRRAAVYSYSVCSVESCVLTGLHRHNSKSYTAHYYGDGHKYHGYCDIEDCIIGGYHSHNGAYCFGLTK